ncbi:unnamed protein product [Cylindrotheca closterium]|uniref:Uncharacterized protein n=1 Tax=Cylindrotheca closterium TaxID=2856 RepID=A0AAD2FRU3_9STRA|nr:unnamed protein product [Cylindrotheca closterium]
MLPLQNMLFEWSSPSIASSSNNNGGSSRILATSARRPRVVISEISLRPVGHFKRGFFDHLKPRAFILGSIRVTTQQGALIMANFMTEQLDGDMKRQEKVKKGELTQREADEEADKWETEEWEKKWSSLQSKAVVAFAKFHAVTLVMRLYEKIAAKYYDEVRMDKLTMDPFTASLTMSAKGETKSEVMHSMFHTTFSANLIAYMADYSVHQAILFYGYYIYIRDRRKKRLQEGEGEDKEGFNGALATSMLKKSTQLAISRGFGLVCTAIGGGVGTILWPGWGAILVGNMGDSVGSMVLDDGTSKK